MSPVITNAAVNLSWNSARLLALILNALNGLLFYYDQNQGVLSHDALFGLRVIEGQLDHVYTEFHNQGYHKDIFEALRNLSIQAGNIGSKGAAILETSDPQSYGKLSPILNKPFWAGFGPLQQIDERHRWPDKEHFNEKTHRVWFGLEGSDNTCLLELISTPCEISPHCASNFLNKSRLNGYQLSNQVLYILVAKSLHCEEKLEQALKEKKPLEDHLMEYCTNIHFEVNKYRRDKKKLAKIDQQDLELLLEQMFVCGQLGFVEFVDTHLIVTALAWQHPKLGCYTNTRPEGIPNLGLSGDFGVKTVEMSRPEDTCLPHLSAVAACVLATALRFILDPNPSAEYHADRLVTIDKIVAEDQFHTFKYIQWVRDVAHFPAGMRPPKPPPVAWAPDLIAFVVLLFIFLLVSVVAHNACTSSSRPFGRQKQLYPFAYKKL